MEVEDFGNISKKIMSSLYSLTLVADVPVITLSQLEEEFNSDKLVISPAEIYGFIEELDANNWLRKQNCFTNGIGPYGQDPESGNPIPENDVYIYQTAKGHTFKERLTRYKRRNCWQLGSVILSPVLVSIATAIITRWLS